MDVLLVIFESIIDGGHGRVLALISGRNQDGDDLLLSSLSGKPFSCSAGADLSSSLWYVRDKHSCVVRV